MEYAAFTLAELFCLPVDQQVSLRNIKAEFAELQYFFALHCIVFARRLPAKYYVYPVEKFSETERLQNVIVRAYFKSVQPVVFHGARGEKKEGYAGMFLFQPGGQFIAVHLGQHHIKYAEVKVALLYQFQGLVAAAFQLYLKALALQIFL